MDRLPQDYVLHNLPLLLLSGLNTRSPNEPNPVGHAHDFLHQGGFRIKVDAPLIDGPLAEHLIRSFNDQDASNLPWHSQPSASRNGRLFKVACVGRVGQHALESSHLSKHRCADVKIRSILSLLAKPLRLLILPDCRQWVLMEVCPLPWCFTRLYHL